MSRASFAVRDGVFERFACAPGEGRGVDGHVLGFFFDNLDCVGAAGGVVGGQAPEVVGDEGVGAVEVEFLVWAGSGGVEGDEDAEEVDEEAGEERHCVVW